MVSLQICWPYAMNNATPTAHARARAQRETGRLECVGGGSEGARKQEGESYHRTYHYSAYHGTHGTEHSAVAPSVRTFRTFRTFRTPTHAPLSMNKACKRVKYVTHRRRLVCETRYEK